MDVQAFLERIRHAPGYGGQIAHVETLPERTARYADPERPLPEALRRLLEARGIERLYAHQARAIDLARAGRDWVITTGTASGKTLGYHLPILETCLEDPDARALFLYPTKALAQDQLKGLLELLGGDEATWGACIPGVYDGDTPVAQRRRIQSEANLVLSNPDMLHASILPGHARWARFWSGLRYVVLDEAHSHRGILGANVACVLRRLMRVCEHYGARPQFLAASATIANPGELVGRLIGRDVAVIDDDGSPRGPKRFVLWNPQPPGKDRLALRSNTDDAVWLLTEAVQCGAQSLAFTRTRVQAELIERYAREALARRHSPHAESVKAYRGGYLANERRELEEALFSGRLRAAAATNALELGLDIGSLDLVLLVGYPGTIASSLQQSGRAGRRSEASLAVLVAANDPIDQFLLRHPDYFFAQSPEHAVVDPDNPYVLARHLKAAAFELPLEERDGPRFGPLTEEVAGLLHDAGELTRLDGRYFFAGHEAPAPRISLRHMSDNTFAIVERRDGDRGPGAAADRASAAGDDPPPVGRGGAKRTAPAGYDVIAQVDAISAPELVYPEAVYLHHGESYLVRRLDLEGKIAYVERRETDYYTQAVLETTVTLGRTRRDQSRDPLAWAAYGDVEAAWQTVAFKKIKFGTRENLGLGPVAIPPQTLPSTGFWLRPGDELRARLKREGRRTAEALIGLRNLALTALPLVAMCDPRDVSGVVDSKNLGQSTLVLYDRYPGGLGYCQRGFEELGRLLELCRQLVVECPCEEGCPSCVGMPNLRPAQHADPDLTRGYPMPDKAATRLLCELLAAGWAAGGAGEAASVETAIGGAAV